MWSGGLFLLASAPTLWAHRLPASPPSYQGVRCGLSSIQCDTQLHAAVAEGDGDLLRQLLSEGAEPDAAAAGGSTPLIVAAVMGDLDACLILVAAGATVTVKDEFGLTALHWAVLSGHAVVASLLLQCDPEQAAILSAGLTPLMLASATGVPDVVSALLSSGVDGIGTAGAHGLTALDLACTMGHGDVAHLLREYGVTEQVLTLSEPKQLSMPEALAEGAVRIIGAADLERSRDPWDAALRDSVPLLVNDFGAEWANPIGASDPQELRRRWGSQSVQVAFSSDARYQRFVEAPASSCAAKDVFEERAEVLLLEPPAQRLVFSEFVDLLDNRSNGECVAVQQSRTSSLAEFDGLPHVPPLLAQLLDISPDTALSDLGLPPGATPSSAAADVTCERSDGAAMAPAEQVNRHEAFYLKQNLWVCKPPKLSQLHFDGDDSVLLQLSGSKRFTLIDPFPLHGLTAYPAKQRVQELVRLKVGLYEARSTVSQRWYDNFPLVNITHPNLERHPLFAHARVITVDVPQGAALVLPAYWYHQVESFAPKDRLNVAINFWFNAGSSSGTRHGVMREKLRVRNGPPVESAPLL